VLLVGDPAATGLHGAEEKEAFTTLPPLAAAASGELCRRVLMQALPALAERDISAFGAAVSRIQEIVGDYFAPEQGGRRYTSANVERLIARLRSEGATGVGQTSWGPTGFAFVESDAIAQRLVASVAKEARGLSLSIHKGCNRGASIDAVYARLA
jgi:beta-ribofuranosylaminobenzene 5'-phosphate synthase